MRIRNKAKWVVILGMVATGSIELATCSPSSILSTVGGINPCGTVLTCDPATYNFIRAGYNGPGVNPNVDVFCTYPPFCGTSDPIFGTVTVP